jgi:hypothetical protein
MPLLFIIKAFKVFLIFFFAGFTLSFPLFEGFAIVLIYDVGVSFFLLPEIAVLARVFLLFSTKIIIQAADHANQVFLSIVVEQPAHGAKTTQEPA